MMQLKFTTEQLVRFTFCGLVCSTESIQKCQLYKPFAKENACCMRELTELDHSFYSNYRWPYDEFDSL